MEFGPNTSPEFSSDEDEYKDKKKEKKGFSLPLGVEKPSLDESKVKPEKQADENEGLGDMFARIKSEAGAEATEQDAPLESLSKHEERDIVDQYIDSILPEVTEELSDAPVDSSEALQAAAHQAFLEDVRSRIADNEDAHEALDAAVGDIEQELQVEDNEPESNERHAANVTQTSFEPPQPVRAAPAQEYKPNPTAARGTAGGTPPIPPVAHTAPSAPSEPPEHGSAHHFSPTPIAETVLQSARRTREVRHAEQRARLQGFLLGGALGYLVGRRRGRIKTEARMAPVQEKLEKQVKTLHETVQSKELQVRKLAAAKAELETRTTRIESAQQSTHEHAPTIEKRAVLEAAGAHVARQEVSYAASDAARAEAVPSALQGIEGRQRPVPKTTEQLNQDELLQIAESVTIDGVSLKQIYETHTVDNQGLRRLVGEHLRGGNTKAALAREVSTHTRSRFERDPSQRQDAQGGVSGGGSARNVRSSPPASVQDDQTTSPYTIHVTPEMRASHARIKQTYEARMVWRTVVVILAVVIVIGVIFVIR